MKPQIIDQLIIKIQTKVSDVKNICYSSFWSLARVAIMELNKYIVFDKAPRTMLFAIPIFLIIKGEKILPIPQKK